MAKKSKRIEIEDVINVLSKFKGKYDVDIQGMRFEDPNGYTIGDFHFPSFGVIGLPSKIVMERIVLTKKEEDAKLEDVALQEYKDALKVALQKRKQYTYQHFKTLSRDKNITEELLNNIAETCNESFYDRLQDGEREFDEKINYKEFMGL